jgi:hypothetical protein
MVEKEFEKIDNMREVAEKLRLGRRRFLKRLAIAASLGALGILKEKAEAWPPCPCDGGCDSCDVNTCDDHTCIGSDTCRIDSCEYHECDTDTCSESDRCGSRNRCDTDTCTTTNACSADTCGTNTCDPNTCGANTCTSDTCSSDTCTIDGCDSDTCTEDDECTLSNKCESMNIDCGVLDWS